MNLRRAGVFAILVLILALLSIELISQYKERSKLSEDASKLKAEVSSLERENAENERNLKYYAVPENMEKDLRERFNYKKPDEKMIIVIPNTGEAE